MVLSVPAAIPGEDLVRYERHIKSLQVSRIFLLIIDYIITFNFAICFI